MHVHIGKVKHLFGPIPDWQLKRRDTSLEWREVHPSFLLPCYFPFSLQLWREASSIDAIVLPVLLLLPVRSYTWEKQTLLSFQKQRRAVGNCILTFMEFPVHFLLIGWLFSERTPAKDDQRSLISQDIYCNKALIKISSQASNANRSKRFFFFENNVGNGKPLLVVSCALSFD